jgi:hypothetical protein
MRNGTSLTLIAVGAILAFAVHAHLQVISFFAVGVILMLVGAIGPLVTRANFSRGGITIAAPAASPEVVVNSEDLIADIAGTDAPAQPHTTASASSVEHAADSQPLPEARTSDSEWSSPRTGLRAV